MSKKKEIGFISMKIQSYHVNFFYLCTAILDRFNSLEFNIENPKPLISTLD